MKQPRHWLDDRPSAIGARLLNTASKEALPDGALQRVGKRLGVSAAVVGAASITSGVASAEAAVGTTAAATAVGTAAAVASGKLTSVGLILTLTKAVGLGLLAGGLVVGAARWAAPSRSDTAAARAPIPSAIRSTTQGALARAAASVAPLPTGVDTTNREHDAAELVQNGDKRAVETPASGREGVPAVRDGSALNGVGAEQPSFADKATAARRAELAPQPAAQGTAIPPHEPQSAEPLNHLPTQDRPATAAVARFGDDVQRVPTASARTPNAPTVPSVLPPEPSTKRSALAAEVRAIDSVRSAVLSGEFRRALEELAQGERVGTFVSLRVEAAVLRVQALDGTGRVTEATNLARRLLRGSLSPSQRQKLEDWLAKRDKE
jgi:hypothetical protein